MTSQDVGGTAGDTFTDLSIHGSKPSEQRQTIGGVSAATIIRFGESLSSSPSFTAMQEMSLDTSGADASMAGGGVRLNYVPRDGGNTFKGLLFFTGANSSMQAVNYTTIADDPVTSLQARGLRTQPGGVDTIYDFNPGFGGPIMKDRLWFFATVRWTRATNFVTQNYPNKNFVVGRDSPFTLNNTTLTYNPDTSAPLRVGSAGDFKEQTLRLSWQINAEEQARRVLQQQEAGHRPEPEHDDVVRSVELRLLLPVLRSVAELVGAAHQPAAARGGRLAPPGDLGRLGRAVRPGRPAGDRRHRQQPRGPGPRLHAADHARITGVRAPAYTPSHNPNTRGNFSMSYVTGAHSVQSRVRPRQRGARILDRRDPALQHRRQHAGEQRTRGRHTGADQHLHELVRLRRSVRAHGERQSLTTPTTTNQADVFKYGCPTFQLAKLDLEAGLFVQDRWTMERVTVSAGVRFDFFNASQPAYRLYPSLVTPNRNYEVPEYQTQRQKDITPKLAAAWDVFGDGKTALKVNLAKYVLGQALSAPQLSVTSNSNVVTTATRTWNDNNGNFLPDCDLTNPAGPGAHAVGTRQPG